MVTKRQLLHSPFPRPRSSDAEGNKLESKAHALRAKLARVEEWRLTAGGVSLLSAILDHQQKADNVLAR